jgi:cell division protein FtsB
MNWGSPEFVLVIIAISTGGWIINNWIRAKHGYALEDEWGGKTVKNDKQVAALQAENTELKERLALFEDRVIVLERIATDKSVGLAAQIENLRTGEKVQ